MNSMSGVVVTFSGLSLARAASNDTPPLSDSFLSDSRKAR